ncbi:MAG: hypothetical protein WCO94_11945 [Verrucomicrobiota bacterium]
MTTQAYLQNQSSDISEISLDESRDLIRLEEIVSKGIETWIEVGNALLEIRDRKLYRIEHGTFEDYCRSKWNIDRTYAHRLMSGAEVVNANKDLLPIGNISEGAIREAVKVKDPVKQREVIKKAVVISGGKTPTAKTVKVVVEQQAEPQIKQAAAKVVEGEGSDPLHDAEVEITRIVVEAAQSVFREHGKKMPVNAPQAIRKSVSDLLGVWILAALISVDGGASK